MKLLGAQLTSVTSGSHGTTPRRMRASRATLTRAARADGAAASCSRTARGHHVRIVMAVPCSRSTKNPRRASPGARWCPASTRCGAGVTSLRAGALRIPRPTPVGSSIPRSWAQGRCWTTPAQIGDTRSTSTNVAAASCSTDRAALSTFPAAAAESLAGDTNCHPRPRGSLPCAGSRLVHDRKDPAWEAHLPTIGSCGTRHTRTKPVHGPGTTPVLEATNHQEPWRGEIAKAWRRKPVAKLLSGPPWWYCRSSRAGPHARFSFWHPA